MKRHFFTRLLPMMALVAVLGFSSCEKNYYQVGADIDNNWFVVEKPSEWRTNQELGRLQVEFDFPALDKYLLEDGALVGAMVIPEGKNRELFVQLPYVMTYPYIDADDPSIEYITETYDYEVYLDERGRGKAIFYIQSSDLNDAKANLWDSYEFKIAYIWRH